MMNTQFSQFGAAYNSKWLFSVIVDTGKEQWHYYNIISYVSQFEQSEEVKMNWRQQLPIQVPSDYSLNIVIDEGTERSQFQFKSVTNIVFLIGYELICNWQTQGMNLSYNRISISNKRQCKNTKTLGL